MSTTVSYKGQNIATVSNNTKTLETEGKYLEADVILTDSSIIPSGTYTVSSSGTADITNYASLSVPSGSAGSPALSVSEVTNHSVTVRASTIRTAGWIPSGTVQGASRNISAADLVSGTKSITSNGTGIDVTNYASVDVAVQGGITPTGNIDITSAGTTDVTQYATATVPSASFFVVPMDDPLFYTEDGVRKWRYRATVEIDPNEGDNAGWIDEGVYHSEYNEMYAVPSNTSITPTESAQTIGGANTMMEGAVTVNAIPSTYVGSGIDRRDSTDLTASGATVSVPSGFYENNASKAVASGTEGTPTATKSAVSNHAVTVTPSVTNSAGYINGGTHSGTAVSVSASELVSGSQTLSDNGTYDVTNLAEVVVDVQGGGGGSVQIATKTATPSAASSSIQFTGLSGNPTSFVVTSQADIATNTNGVTAVVFDGSSLHGQTMTTEVTADTGFTKSYSSGTLTITATSAQFQANAYKLAYTYGGSSSDIKTADMQVGSGATSITFSVNGRPTYWSCIFKSDFSTSSGYQRVIAVANDGSSTYGLAMDSSAHAATSWTASYSGGNFTINSQSTNNGGYFHQPGYYQLTYAVDDSAPSYQTKSVYATTSAQTITADNGYDALEQVNLGAISQTNLTAGNIKSGTTISISNGSTNLWSVTGTYSGGGGTSKNTQVVQGTTRTTSSSMTAIGAELTVSKTGTYDIYWSGFRSSTSSSYTFATQLYIDSTAYGSENTTWSNHVQNNHLTNVSLTANQKIRVYGRNSRGSSYYIYAPTLVIVET